MRKNFALHKFNHNFPGLSGEFYHY